MLASYPMHYFSLKAPYVEPIPEPGESNMGKVLRHRLSAGGDPEFEVHFEGYQKKDNTRTH